MIRFFVGFPYDTVIRQLSYIFHSKNSKERSRSLTIYYFYVYLQHHFHLIRN